MQHNRENQLRITDLEKWTFNIQHQAAEPAATFFPGPLPLVIPNFTTPPFVILPVLRARFAMEERPICAPRILPIGTMLVRGSALHDSKR